MLLWDLLPRNLTIFRLSAALALCVALAPQSSALGFNLMPFEIPETPYEEWQTMRGDFLVVDTEANMGYLVHEDGGYTSFRVATGQRRVVRYIGRTYNAKTPNRRWVSLSSEVKGDRTTFGKEGTFLRLYDDGENSPYGIHSHKSVEKMLAGDAEERYRSMGCIIVSEAVLDNIEATFAMNGDRLDVVTTNGFEGAPVNYATLKAQIDQNKL